MRISRRELVLLLVAVALTTIGWALANSYPGYDAYYHLVWGRELDAGQIPTIDA